MACSECARGGGGLPFRIRVHLSGVRGSQRVVIEPLKVSLTFIGVTLILIETNCVYLRDSV